MRRYHPLAVLSVLVAAAVVACSPKDRPAAAQTASAANTPMAAAAPATAAPAAAPAAQQVTISAKDFAFDAPDTITSGVTTIHLVNHGPSAHHVQLIRMDAPHTFAELVKGLAHPGPTPAWVHFAGGPNAAMPGAETQATMDLAAGNYAIICVIPGPDGVPHFAKGMARPLTVVRATGPAAAEAAADDTVKLMDYGFVPTTAFTTGHHVLRVVNVGKQPHEMVIVRLNPGKTAAEFADWAEHGQKGPPPGILLGGATGLDVGTSEDVPVDFTAGDYALICFFPDAKDGKPHYAHGMIHTFKIS